MKLSDLNDAERRDLILEALTSLSDRYASIYSKRNGLHDGIPWTYEAIGNEQGCTRQMIHKIVKKADVQFRKAFELVLQKRGIVS